MAEKLWPLYGKEVGDVRTEHVVEDGLLKIIGPHVVINFTAVKSRISTSDVVAL